MDTAFQILGLLGLCSIIIGPWIHAWKLEKIDTRLTEIENKIETITFDDSDNDYDPDPEQEPISEDTNIIAIGRKAA